MPWKESNVMDQKTEFSLKSFRQGVPFTSLCQEYGISRKTGYKWQKRFLDQGLDGMFDKSRRPFTSPSSLPEQTVCAIIRIKNAHPFWGPKKIRDIYQRQFGHAPCLSSFKRVLDKAGLVKHRKRRKAKSNERITTDLPVNNPNDVWTVDFKGWWNTCANNRCEPLTIRDLYSKYILELKAMDTTKALAVKRVFEGVFERYGLPIVIKSDNGPPFATSNAILGLSSLAVWWIALGIRLHRIPPGHPEQNGSHERMHRDIKTEIQGTFKGNMEEHQVRFDIWRKEYNWERPHESIGMKFPGEIYTSSSRKWDGTPDVIEYEPAYFTRKVSRNGSIKVESQAIRISTALTGWDVGLKYFEENKCEVYFDYLRLGEIDLEMSKFTPTQVNRKKMNEKPKKIK